MNLNLILDWRRLDVCGGGCETVLASATNPRQAVTMVGSRHTLTVRNAMVCDMCLAHNSACFERASHLQSIGNTRASQCMAAHMQERIDNIVALFCRNTPGAVHYLTTEVEAE